MIGLLRILPDVDMDSLNRFAMAVLLWPVATPVLWIAETALLSFAYKMCAKLRTARAMWIGSALATVAIIAGVTWLFWTVSANSLSVT
ncbi:hypothetical protein [Kibdelosporangium phytohabitans]|uniref:Uncharacterized protein n=1 Tax=Kibdelosporangium phytohabitans TaxID=860235 RepID=A0A0N9IA90_9PSEU|nr:hypothetical protein [Kibdelosporangium phytohabitans]ALG11650.1 hypothetical protein AOZ06_36550 [Kibdelosporangium phytohabitans]MBE1463037.1 hypothetical protein [Kibdelosporangium phytohabitans]